MQSDHPTRYLLELELPERDGARDDAAAKALLRSEFALALNASYFLALSAGEIDVRVLERTARQEGPARYAVELEFVERDPSMSDEQAGALLRSEFSRALNASHFLRICPDEITVAAIGRDRGDSRVSARAAA